MCTRPSICLLLQTFLREAKYKIKTVVELQVSTSVYVPELGV